MELPPPLTALLADTFPGATLTSLAPTVGGFSNLTLAVRLNGRACVLKAASAPARRADLRREAAMLRMLQGRHLGAPPLLAHAEADDWTLLVTARRPGRPGITLYIRPPAQLVPAYHALGRTLSRLHRSTLAPPPGAAANGMLIAARAARLRAELATLPLADELRVPLARALDHPTWRPIAPCLVHGDAGLHNIVWATPRLSLLDWELAGWADPRLDLAWVAWTIRFRSLSNELWSALLTGYGPQRAPVCSLDPATNAALALGQVATLLARAHGRPDAWAEWQRRAQWTITHYAC
jgi:aminoglycoside phosphotransferase (APT) family kinase protein